MKTKQINRLLEEISIIKNKSTSMIDHFDKMKDLINAATKGEKYQGNQNAQKQKPVYEDP